MMTQLYLIFTTLVALNQEHNFSLQNGVERDRSNFKEWMMMSGLISNDTTKKLLKNLVSYSF